MRSDITSVEETPARGARSATEMYAEDAETSRRTDSSPCPAGIGAYSPTSSRLSRVALPPALVVSVLVTRSAQKRGR
jgi:hypothetical protein